MLAPGPYLAATLSLAFLAAALSYSAWRLRQLILPGWSGAVARLAEIVLAVGLITALGLLLGTFSLFSRPGLMIGAGVVAVTTSLITRRYQAGTTTVPPSQLPEQSNGSRLAALVLAGVVFAHWGIAVSWSLDAGITNFDSVWYHLPFAAEIAQSGSTLTLVHTDTVFLNWLYPQGSELLHAVGMALTERDLVSLGLNLGWLGLALLAAWCLGRPFGRGHLTVAAAAILLECHNLVAREPGTAKNDIVAVALLLAAAALIVNLHHAGSVRDRRLPSGVGPGWSLGLVALAVGLAAGTKVTALAPAAGLTLAAIVVSPEGRRLKAMLWWGGGLAVGGAYWYVRNLVVSGNPLPQVREIGPLTLPGPDRLQTGRPDFTVSHYLLDGTVWRDYLSPGLERGFGTLWPLVVAGALAGALLAIGRLWTARRDSVSGGRREDTRLIGLLGLAALVGMVAYLFTPLSAAGPEGSPTAFAINLRFVIPALMLGLVLLPVCLPLRSPAAAWGVFALLVAVGLFTNRANDVLIQSGRLFGWAVAVAVLLPVLATWAWAALRSPHSPSTQTPPTPGISLLHRSHFLAGLALLYGVALLAFCYPLQRGYFEDRYADFAPELGLSEVYSWASEQEGRRIGLAGTTAGFHGFGFYGVDLSNRVEYLGVEAPKGGFDAITECGRFRRAVNDAKLDYLVTSPFLNFFDTGQPISSPEVRWVANDPSLDLELQQDDVALWRITGSLAEGCGPAEEPHRELPDSPIP